MAVAKERQDKFLETSTKPPKLFISHKTEDKEYADALVSLINYIIGRDDDKIFCSSIAGYGIKPSQDIINEIKNQFDNYNVFMVIIHSPRYYKSPVCLNEMGAAWATNARFCSFLTKDCSIDLLGGVIGKGEICINLNDEEEMFNSHLNSFKDDLISFFGVPPMVGTKWEHERTKFAKALEAITIKETEGRDGDYTYNLFDILYLPSLDTIFEQLDVDHFSKWAYDCAISGNTILRKSTYERIERTISYIKSRPKHEKYESWDSLIKNLGQLLSDFRYVFSLHSDDFGDDAYYVTRFYKEGPYGKGFNPNYDVDLKAYNEYVCLISDLIFELTRLCNLLLTRVREIHPEYRQELGILHIEGLISDSDLVYRSEEISDNPYPGIAAFISKRLTREKHFGHSGTINIDGYER